MFGFAGAKRAHYSHWSLVIQLPLALTEFECWNVCLNVSGCWFFTFLLRIIISIPLSCTCVGNRLLWGEFPYGVLLVFVMDVF